MNNQIFNYLLNLKEKIIQLLRDVLHHCIMNPEKGVLLNLKIKIELTINFNKIINKEKENSFGTPIVFFCRSIKQHYVSKSIYMQSFIFQFPIFKRNKNRFATVKTILMIHYLIIYFRILPLRLNYVGPAMQFNRIFVFLIFMFCFIFTSLHH